MVGSIHNGPTGSGSFSANSIRSFGETAKQLKKPDAQFLHLWKLGVNVTALKMYRITAVTDLRVILNHVTEISVKLINDVDGKIQLLEDHELAKVVSSTIKINLPVSGKILFARASGRIDSRPLFEMFFISERTERIPICEFYLSDK